MKLLTLNTHSLIEPEYEAKREIFVEFIAKEQPDVFALQEVNQKPPHRSWKLSRRATRPVRATPFR